MSKSDEDRMQSRDDENRTPAMEGQGSAAGDNPPSDPTTRKPRKRPVITPTTRCFKLTVAYNGTNYAGWQLQPGDQPSIQARLESAVAEITGRHSRVIGSGRTDAGVHAIGQVASFLTERWRVDAVRLIPALNRFLPRDIVVRTAEEKNPTFHAIRDSIGKHYRYTIRAAPMHDPLNLPFQWWIRRPLDIEAMQLAAQRFQGKLDFASMQGQGSPRRSSVRTIHNLDVTPVATFDGTLLHIDVKADGFLYNMVRNIVGTLVEVGFGNRPVRWVDQVLASRDRSEAGQTAPPNGLCLMEVYYPD